MLFTSTLYGPYSFDRLFTRPLTAERTEFDSTSPSIGCLTETEVMVRNRPQRCFCIRGSTSRAKYTVLIKFRLTAASQSSTVVSANFLDGGPPAFVTQISM